MRKARYHRGLSLSLSMEHFEKIKKITDDREISIAEFIREVLSEVLRCYDNKERGVNHDNIK